MNPGASAATATGKYLQRYIECRELEAEIYSKPASVPPNMSEVELGKSFALSALYGLNLDVSECKLCFRCCRKDDSVSPPFATVNGVFDFIQTLMSLTVADINREPGIMKSYSECLAVPLLRYSRGEELRVTNVVTNSVVSDGVIRSEERR
ncbi:MAG: hypothetical protein LBT88_07875, partial [Oscillospiraceae bacterium]|nr:hypothetical protein [Oscillospiraceae bacterium]